MLVNGVVKWSLRLCPILLLTKKLSVLHYTASLTHNQIPKSRTSSTIGRRIHWVTVKGLKPSQSPWDYSGHINIVRTTSEVELKWLTWTWRHGDNNQRKGWTYRSPGPTNLRVCTCRKSRNLVKVSKLLFFFDQPNRLAISITWVSFNVILVIWRIHIFWNASASVPRWPKSFKYIPFSYCEPCLTTGK